MKSWHLLCVVAVWWCLVPQWGWCDCIKKGPCSCEEPNGLIDLSPLDGGSTPKFKDKVATTFKDDYFYSWNPCTPFSEGSGCKEVSGCQVGSGKVLSYPIGTQTSANFSYDSAGQLSIQYSAKGDYGERYLGISLVCEESAEGELTVLGEISNLHYGMILSSTHCCPKTTESGLSVGSILLIVFFVALVVYIVAGTLLMKFVKKASGKEVIPNYALWSAVPGLIKDGAVFTVSSVRSIGKRRTYQKM